MRLSTAAFALFISLVVPAAAHASDLVTITSGDSTMSFLTPASPTPTGYVEGFDFYLNNVPVDLNGVPTTDDIAFYTEADGGGFGDNIFGAPYAALLFSGDVSDPELTPGVYAFSFEAPDGPTDGTITITANAPEPNSLLLLATGATSLTGILRRRRR